MLTANATDKVVSGRTILLTGAGGSIGSALAKAVMRLEPTRLILLDHSERNLNEIDLEMTGMGCDSHTAVLGDICDAKLLCEIFHRYRPEIVYHAAAYKHVPLMENNPFAAVRNNALGTAGLARLSQAEGVAIFLMVSTDKAVNPISVMGASKRVAELALLSLNNSQSQMGALRLGKPHVGNCFKVFIRLVYCSNIPVLPDKRYNCLKSQNSIVFRFRFSLSLCDEKFEIHTELGRCFSFELMRNLWKQHVNFGIGDVDVVFHRGLAYFRTG